MKTENVTIIGMERIGASIGMALKQSSLGLTIIGHDPDPGLMQEAKKQNAIDVEERNIRQAAAKADILILAVRVSELEETLQLIGEDVQAHTLIVDLSRLKAAGMEWAGKYLKQGHYVGAYPVLAAASLTDGYEGIENASPDLFHDSVFCLMPSPKVDPEAVETAINLGAILGATPYFLDAAEYDNLIQGIETVPGLMAVALFSAIHKAKGWRDMLRFADSTFAQTTLPLRRAADITQLALNDKEATLRWLEALLEELKEVRRWIYEGDAETLGAILERLSIEREKWLREREENEWIEVKSPNVEIGGFAQQVLGGLGRKRGQKE